MNPFEGSIHLMTLADDIEEIKTICECGKKASINARIVNGKIVSEGEQVQIGGNETYTTLCRKCYKYKINNDILKEETQKDLNGDMTEDFNPFENCR